jgi:hypothetical protein
MLVRDLEARGRESGPVAERIALVEPLALAVGGLY